MNTPTLLLVEDSPLLLALAKRMISSLAVNIICANNGREAWEVIDRQTIDILVTDIIMPEMTGFDLIVKLRADHRFKDVFILVMTSLDQVADKVRALSSGANDYVVKPLEPQEFQARVASGIKEVTLKKQLRLAMATLDDELKAVAKIQKKLLPESLPSDERVSLAVSYQPWSRSGGDYYNGCYDENGRLIITLADVSGHGAGAAVLVAMFRVIFDTTMALGLPVHKFMWELNRALLKQIGKEPTFITACMAIMSPDGREVEFCSAGHGDQYLIGPAKGEVRHLTSGGPVLGFFDSLWECQRFSVQPGQTLLMFTDGLIEAVNADNEEFGTNRLEAVLNGLDPLTEPQRMVDALLEAVKQFSGPVEFSDDVTILVTSFH